jgi:multiple sugar transport system substrate-binding protein
MGNERGRSGGAIRRRLALGGGIGLGGGVLAACLGDGAAAPGARSAARGTVTFMSQQAGAVDQGRYQPVVEQFNARGGPVTIDLQEGGGGIAEVQQKLVTTVAADTPPDVFWTHCYINPTLVKARIPADLGPYLRRDRDPKPEAYFETSFKDYEWDGKQYGVALWATTTVLLANLGLFARNGVAPPQESWTWDDFLKAAQALSRGAGGEQTWGVGASTDNFPIVKAWQEGGDLVDKSRTRWTLHETPAVEQVQWVADLVTRHRVWPERASDPGWNSGRVGMVVALSDYNAYNKAEFDWDIFALPRGKARLTRTASAGISLAAGSKNKDAAWVAFTYLVSKPMYENLARLGVTIPTLKEVAQGPLVLRPDQRPASARLALDAFAYARTEPINGDWATVRAEYAKALNETLAGTVSARQAMAAIAPVVEPLLGKAVAPAAPAPSMATATGGAR